MLSKLRFRPCRMKIFLRFTMPILQQQTNALFKCLLYVNLKANEFKITSETFSNGYGRARSIRDEIETWKLIMKLVFLFYRPHPRCASLLRDYPWWFISRWNRLTLKVRKISAGTAGSCRYRRQFAASCRNRGQSDRRRYTEFLPMPAPICRRHITLLS